MSSFKSQEVQISQSGIIYRFYRLYSQITTLMFVTLPGMFTLHVSHTHTHTHDDILDMLQKSGQQFLLSNKFKLKWRQTREINRAYRLRASYSKMYHMGHLLFYNIIVKGIPWVIHG